MLQFLWLPRFFGLTLEYRQSVFKIIHEIVFHGKGGYDWPTVYNMPIWLRNFTFSTMQTHFKEEQKKIDEVQNKGKQTAIGPDGKVNPQAFTRPTKSKYK